jgi:hypothetical protein
MRQTKKTNFSAPNPSSYKVIKADAAFMHVMLPSVPCSSVLTPSHVSHMSEFTDLSQPVFTAGNSVGRLNPKDKTTSSWKLAYITDDLRLYDG